LRAVIAVGSVLVDFDGTACRHDVAEHLLVRFGDPSWEELDRAWEAGDLGGREVLTRQADMLVAPTEALLDFALAHCPIDPTFGPFIEWCRGRGIDVALVSDGFGFYIEPLLRAAGIEGVGVITNTWSDVGPPRLRYERSLPDCRWCGTCKVTAIAEARQATGAVAFVGDAGSDRYGARAADLVFAKDRLPALCEADGVPYVPWNDFDDVRRALADGATTHPPIEPERCPGREDP
jgi:2-hydroxy-3-keto-5-methylthiopentenyl-1-phosphate phosphatase